MRSVHLVIPDLFLPKDIAEDVVAGLSLPALQKMLGRGHSEILDPAPLETLLCEMFGIAFQYDVPIAPISAAFDGLAAGCWLRADPVHLKLQRDQLLMDGVSVSSEEAALLCTSLNEHFAGQGMEFVAPHPQRWYVRLDMLPRISTTPISQVIGTDVRKLLPTGADAAHWHQVFNEIQMLLHAHPLNESREARGEQTINSVWIWGGGYGKSISLQNIYASASSDEVLVEMLAAAANIPFSAWSEKWRDTESDGMQLLVWTGLRSALQSGDLAAWRNALQEFESGYAVPLWQALHSGRIDGLQMDVLAIDGVRRVRLKRGNTWAFWRRSKRLAEYSMV